ncbi:MAG: PmoA family protein [Prolixibacteraceae bacterium]|nr:PmoA family protein [Prolixibacteraceae bacterium]
MNKMFKVKSFLCDKYHCKSLIIAFSFSCWFFITMILISITSCQISKKKEIVLGNITVKAGEFDRTDLPVAFECKLTNLTEDRIVTDSLNNFQIILHETGRKNSYLYAQWLPETGFGREKTTGNGTLIFILSGKTEKNSSRSFKLILQEKNQTEFPFSITDINEKSLLIQHNKKPVFQYNYGIMREKEGEINDFDRSSYIHPVWTHSGKIITGDFSPEHIHQRGIFKAWQQVKFDSIKTDFWSVAMDLFDARGTILLDKKGFEIINGPVLAQLTVHNKGTVGGDKIFFREINTIRLFNRTNENTWMFDIVSKEIPVDPDDPYLFPQSLKTMVLQKVHYGGMAFRGASPDWLRPEAISIDDEKYTRDSIYLAPEDSLDVLTSEGHNRFTGNGTPARWIDYTGPLDKEWGGIAVFDHSVNKRYPTPLRIHPYLPYFCYAFTKDSSFIVNSDEPLELQYRFLVHNGHPDKIINEEIARDFVYPPEVIWKKR